MNAVTSDQLVRTLESTLALEGLTCGEFSTTAAPGTNNDENKVEVICRSGLTCLAFSEAISSACFRTIEGGINVDCPINTNRQDIGDATKRQGSKRRKEREEPEVIDGVIRNIWHIGMCFLLSRISHPAAVRDIADRPAQCSLTDLSQNASAFVEMLVATFPESSMETLGDFFDEILSKDCQGLLTLALSEIRPDGNLADLERF